MGQTTLIRKKKDMVTKPLPRCHDGVGDLEFIDVVAGKNGPGAHLQWFHDDILKPGVSIGVHRHDNNEEYYYILSGKGIMTLDGERHEVGPGDITAVLPGGSHGLENTGTTDMRIVVVAVH
jgi:oxalate decarboxylase/phosphoglucose isomerase-like protein (cupin superfamily)